MLRFNVLGRLEVVADDGPLSLPAGKQRALLAALLIDANHSVSSDRLIDRLWGEAPGSAAAKNLQVQVSQLRKALGEGVIETVSSGYLLRVEPQAIDAERFEHLLERGRHELAEERAGDARRSFDEAISLVRGPPYEDVGYEDFARDEADRLAELVTQAREEQMEALLALDMPAEALPELRKLAAEHPLRERTITLLAAALARTGRRAEALEVYDHTRRLLAEQVGIEPGDRLRRLHAAILESPEQVRADDSLASTPSHHRRPLTLLAVGGGLLAAVAIAASLVVLNRGSSASGIELIGPNSVAAVDPLSGRLTAQYPVGSTPTSVATDGSATWVLNADDATISRIDDAGETITRSPGHSPSDLVYEGGALWMSYADRLTDGQIEPGVARLDPVSLRMLDEVTLRNREGSYGTVPIAATDSAVYASVSGAVIRLDARTLKVTASSSPGGDSIAAGDGAVWVVRHGADLYQLDPSTLSVRDRIHVPSLGGLVQLAVGGGSVWGADGSGLVWRIDATSTRSADSIRIGLSAGDVAYGGGEVWATSAIDGILARIDPQTERVRRFAVGNAPQHVAVDGGHVFVTVAGGGGQPIASGSAAGLSALPSSSCGEPVYGGSGRPDFMIASDFPLDQTDAPVTGAMVQAIEYTLRKHHFKAGRFRVAYQACDDSTSQAGGWDEGKCAANAKSYAATASVIGVIGTLNSGCAAQEIRTLNKASLAMVSPTNSYIGLTKRGVGVSPGDPDTFYPTGKRTYLRDYPADDQQAVADALLLHRLGAHRVYIYNDGTGESYGSMLAGTFAAVAPKVGLAVVGPSTPPSSPQGLKTFVEQLRAQGVDGVFLSGIGPNQGGPPLSGRIVIELRRVFGRLTPIVANDGYLEGFGVADVSPGHPSAGTYISGAYVSDPARQLPPAGVEFVREFSATQPGRTVNTFTPYAAQSTEVLLAAIAASDGTRASVSDHLLSVRVTDGILGSFGFDQNGDMTFNAMPIFRVPGGPPTNGPYPVYTVIQVPGTYTQSLFEK